MQLNLLDLFPEGKDGSRTPLPKQREFIQKVLEPGGPKFVAYISGIGGGKTLSGCIIMLAMGLKYPGDYLISRQYYPELKSTTYKQFKEILPPELILEDRIADMQITIKAAGGKSTFFFRPLEEPDKLRSMNLSGFMIDECDQVSEAAFMLLQGRLRGRGLRKGILVSNPAGHNWAYRWFMKQDFLSTEAKQNYYIIRGSTLDNIHLPDDYVKPMLDSWSKDRIEREIMGSFDSFEGSVYEEFRRDTHVIKPFAIPEAWPRIVGIDHGYRNPSAWLWAAIGPDGEVYVYREFYQSGWLINEIITGKRDTHQPGILNLAKGDPKPQAAYIDPSVKRTNAATGDSDLEEYLRHLPDDYPLMLAKNDVQVGIDRVKSYFKVNAKTKKPNLYIFDDCHNLIEEIAQYRYQELRPNQTENRAEYEKPKKVNDHAVDALRYIIITLPEPYIAKNDIEDTYKKNPAIWKIYSTIKQYKNPLPKDPFES